MVLAEWRARGGCFIACAHRSVADRAMEARSVAGSSFCADGRAAIGKVNTRKRRPSFTRSDGAFEHFEMLLCGDVGDFCSGVTTVARVN